MKGLTSLDLSHNRLEDLPTTLNELVKLRSLELAHNRIDALPAELAQLTALERLGINDNAIAARPHVFDEMFYPARDAEGRAKANVLKALSLNNNALARPFDLAKLRDAAAPRPLIPLSSGTPPSPGSASATGDGKVRTALHASAPKVTILSPPATPTAKPRWYSASSCS